MNGVGILVKEELCEKVVEIRRRSDYDVGVGIWGKDNKSDMCVWTTEWKASCRNGALL